MAIVTTTLVDGFSTNIQLVTNDLTLLNVKTLTPPPVEGGGEIDLTTMENAAWRTRAPKSLKTLGPMTFTCSYDPALYLAEVYAAVNDEQSIIITFPDATTLTFYGFVDTFVPGTHEEGELPEATVTIIPTNVNAGAETAPQHAG